MALSKIGTSALGCSRIRVLVRVPLADTSGMPPKAMTSFKEVVGEVAATGERGETVPTIAMGEDVRIGLVGLDPAPPPGDLIGSSSRYGH